VLGFDERHGKPGRIPREQQRGKRGQLRRVRVRFVHLGLVGVDLQLGLVVRLELVGR
jgi:hypothetical protein